MTQEVYMGGLAGSNIEQIKERKKYLDYVDLKSAELGVSFLDTVYDRKLYGFVDNDYHIIEQNAEVRTFGDYAGEVVGLNFVVSCFNNFRNFFIERVENSSIEIPQDLGSLTPQKSYDNMEINYQRYQKLVSKVFMESLTVGNFSGENYTFNFEGFVKAVDKISFEPGSRNYKVTKSGYVLSPYVTVYETGLYVDLSPQQDPEIDYVKAQLISDANFKCYGEIANKFGFLVDKNCPWRLVVDLKSQIIQSNILNFDTSRPFDDFYHNEYLMRTGLDDYWNLKSFYKRLFMDYIKIKSPGTQLAQSALDSIPEDVWIESYIANRLREIGELRNSDFYSSDVDPTPRKKKFQFILTEALERYRIIEDGQLTGNSGVIKFIEDKCAKLLKKRLTETINDTSMPRYQR